MMAKAKTTDPIKKAASRTPLAALRGGGAGARGGRVWQIPAERVVALKSTAVAVFDVHPKLDRLIAALGLSSAADVLGVDKSQLHRCSKGQEPLGADLQRRISDVEYLLDRALRVFHPDEVGPWLRAPEALLAGSIPLNVLVLEGPARVIGAIDARDAGAYA